MQMKGLSPVVATIILIAFAVAVGGLVSIWLAGFATSTTEFTSEQGDKLTACAGARLKVDRVTATEMIYSNPSSETINNVTVYDQSGRNLTSASISMVSGEVRNLTWARASNTSVFMRGICQESIIVEGSCEDGQICWK